MNLVTVTEKSRLGKFIDSLEKPETLISVMPDKMADAIYKDTKDFRRIPVEVPNPKQHECHRILFRASEVNVKY